MASLRRGKREHLEQIYLDRIEPLRVIDE